MGGWVHVCDWQPNEKQTDREKKKKAVSDATPDVYISLKGTLYIMKQVYPLTWS